MPEFYRNAWYAQLKKKVDELEEEIQKAIELPTVTSADDGKVLTVDNDGKWAAEEIPKELPVVQTTDAGKVLTVDEDGAWSAETPSSGGVNIPYSDTAAQIGTWRDGVTPVYRIVVHGTQTFSEYSKVKKIADLPGTVISGGCLAYDTSSSGTYYPVYFNINESGNWGCLALTVSNSPLNTQVDMRINASSSRTYAYTAFFDYVSLFITQL